jgi:hypothetical protein
MLTTRTRLSSALVVWLSAASALAGQSDGETLFAEGRKLRMKGDCAGAIVRFRQALETYPEGLGSLRNMAACQEQLGLYASARRSWWDLRRGVLKSGAAKYEGWAEDAERAHAALEHKVPRVTIKLAGGKLDGVRVLLDGDSLPKRLWGVPVERDIGEHRIAVWYGAATPFRRVVDLTRGSREVVTFTIPAPTSKPVEDDGEPLRIAGYVAFGVGGLAAIGFGAALGVRQAALADLDAACADYSQCPQAASEPHERGKTASTLVNVFAVAAGVGIAAGIVLVVVGHTTESASLVIAPTVGGAIAGATVPF